LEVVCAVASLTVGHGRKPGVWISRRWEGTAKSQVLDSKVLLERNQLNWIEIRNRRDSNDYWRSKRDQGQ
jgi:hypothetical protein